MSRVSHSFETKVCNTNLNGFVHRKAIPQFVTLVRLQSTGGVFLAGKIPTTVHNTISLVTGANRGLGFEVARLLGREGHTVILGCRNTEHGIAASQKLRFEGLDVHFLPIDVGHAAHALQLRSFFQRFQHLTPNLLINNAAVCLPGSSAVVLRHTLAVNYFGALRLQFALMPLMATIRCADANPCVVNLSSGDGELCMLASRWQRALSAATSLPQVAATLSAAICVAEAAGAADELAFGPTPAYSLSKAALNAATRILATNPPPPALPPEVAAVGAAAAAAKPAAKSAAVRVVAVCPGDVDTAMRDPEPASEVLTAAAAAADVVWAGLAGGGGGGCPSGGFFRARQLIPW